MLQKRTVVHTNHKCFQKEHLCPKRTFVSGPRRALRWVPTSKCKKEHLCLKSTNVSKKNICVGEAQMCQSIFVSEKHRVAQEHKSEKNQKFRYIIYPLLMYIIK